MSEVADFIGEAVRAVVVRIRSVLHSRIMRVHSDSACIGGTKDMPYVVWDMRCDVHHGVRTQGECNMYELIPVCVYLLSMRSSSRVEKVLACGCVHTCMDT